MDRLLPSGLSPRDMGAVGLSKFTVEEDEKLIKLVKRQGKYVNWKNVSIEMETRTPRQCRERYQNYLSPEINNSPWTEAEDKQISQLVKTFGSKWNLIAKSINGRTGNSIRNRYQVLLRKQRKERKNEEKPLKKSPKKEKMQQSNDNCLSEKDSLFDSIINEALGKTYDFFESDTFSSKNALADFL